MALPEGLGIFDLSGRVALVTGAGRGIGRTLACALASAGADVVVAGRTASDLDAAVVEIEGAGRRALAVPTDVTEQAEVEKLVAAAVGAFDRIDILVNNAGANIAKPVLEMEPWEWDSVQALNARAYFLMARAVGPHMVARSFGRVINVTSTLAAIAYRNQGAYAASKGAVTQLGKVLAVEWAPHHITVNCIGPAFIETERTRPRLQDPARRQFIAGRTPMGRWGQTHELAGAAIFLASDAASYVTGHTIYVDGGWLAG